MTEKDVRVSYPYFFSPEVGRFSSLVELPSKILGRDHKIRGYLPPGYDENTLSRFPVVYMQDGQNLFFPEEAFLGQDWKVDKTGDVLRAMNAVEDFLILGIYSGDRMTEYTKPGYERYARSLVEEVVPEVERRGIRAEPHRRFRSVWGSSLGGVVSFYTVWQHPEVFGSAVCMSSTFSHRDDLIDRVFAEPFRDVGFYLDSGWPGDNYEVTVGMAMALDLARLGVRAQPAAPVLPHGRTQRGGLGDAAAPAPAVPERRGGPGLSRQPPGPRRTSVRPLVAHATGRSIVPPSLTNSIWVPGVSWAFTDLGRKAAGRGRCRSGTAWRPGPASVVVGPGHEDTDLGVPLGDRPAPASPNSGVSSVML